jgi:hypothetical protein
VICVEERQVTRKAQGQFIASLTNLKLADGRTVCSREGWERSPNTIGRSTKGRRSASPGPSSTQFLIFKRAPTSHSIRRKVADVTLDFQATTP